MLPKRAITLPFKRSRSQSCTIIMAAPGSTKNVSVTQVPNPRAPAPGFLEDCIEDCIAGCIAGWIARVLGTASKAAPGALEDCIDWITRVLVAASKAARVAAREAARDATLEGSLTLKRLKASRLPKGYDLKAAEGTFRKAHRDAYNAALKRFLYTLSCANDYIKTASGLGTTELTLVNDALTRIADGASTNPDLQLLADSEAYGVLSKELSPLLQMP